MFKFAHQLANNWVNFCSKSLDLFQRNNVKWGVDTPFAIKIHLKKKVAHPEVRIRNRMCWTCHAITFVKSLMSIQPVCFTTISWRWLHYRDSQDSYHPIKTIPILTFGIVTSSFCGFYCEVSPQYIILSYPLTPLPPHSKSFSSLVEKNSFQIVKKKPFGQTISSSLCCFVFLFS